MTMRAPNLTPLHRLFESGRRDDQPVCHDGQRLVLWREFCGRVLALAGQLRQRDESRWLLSSDDPQRFAIELCALLYAGKQVVIPPNTQAGTLAALAGAFDARCTDEEPAAAPLLKLSAIDPQQALIDLYTSGSTGEPKRVRKTLAQLETEVATLELLWGSAIGQAAIVATAPHQHIYGLLFRLLWPLSTGRVFDALTCAHPDTLQERLALFGAAALVSSPAQLARLPELVALTSLQPTPKAIFSSGGPLSAATAATFFRQLGQVPIEVFGSTETGGIAWRRQDGDTGAELWTPFPGIEVGKSERGALLLRSPFVEGGEPWEMDDGVEVMADGRFRLRGRLDRVVKIEEKRLSLPDMELRLGEHPWVGASALVPLSGRRQSIGALVVLNAGGRYQLEARGRRAVAQALRKHLAEHYEPVLLPRHWRFREQMPVSERGKISHSALQALFAMDDNVSLFPELLQVGCDDRDGHKVVLDLHVAPSLAHFAGHFPGLPIVPGVVQIDWAVRYGREHLAIDGHFSGLESVKFLALVFPGTNLRLALRWDPRTRYLAFSYSAGQRKVSAGRIVFGGAQ
jgi:acyl-coenzyme A synthetase/AMP-(fatty) acid ligase/3-hydroxymyristoyl/3-hydroxydecanoyl-(acyl carrier protein) dehydratase